MVGLGLGLPSRAVVDRKERHNERVRNRPKSHEGVLSLMKQLSDYRYQSRDGQF